MIQLNTPFGKIIFLNETNEEEMESTSTEFYYLAAITSSNVIISVFCLLYIILKLTLNKFIKEILSIMAIQNIICSIIMTISTGVMINLNDHSFWTCQRFVLLHQPLTNSQVRNTKLHCLDFCRCCNLIKEETLCSLLFSNWNKNQNKDVWYFAFGLQSPADTTKQTLVWKLQCLC